MLTIHLRTIVERKSRAWNLATGHKRRNVIDELEPAAITISAKPVDGSNCSSYRRPCHLQQQNPARDRLVIHLHNDVINDKPNFVFTFVIFLVRVTCLAPLRVRANQKLNYIHLFYIYLLIARCPFRIYFTRTWDLFLRSPRGVFRSSIHSIAIAINRSCAFHEIRTIGFDRSTGARRASDEWK